MKKILLTVLMVSSIFIATILLTCISFLAHLIVKPNGLILEKLVHGQVLQMLMVKEFWSQYPAIPSANLLFLPSALILMGLLLGSILYLLAYRQKMHPLAVSAVVLLTAVIPYGMGRMILSRNAEAGNAGPWLAFMLVGALYASVACALFSGFEMIKGLAISFRSHKYPSTGLDERSSLPRLL